MQRHQATARRRTTVSGALIRKMQRRHAEDITANLAQLRDGDAALTRLAWRVMARLQLERREGSRLFADVAALTRQQRQQAACHEETYQLARRLTGTFAQNEPLATATPVGAA